MKKIYLFLIALVLVGSVSAKENLNVKKAKAAPEIDAIADPIWDLVSTQDIAKPFGTEAPTVTPTFKAMWDADNFYLYVVVEDDDHFPSWEPEPDGNNWEYDKPEIYFDVNAVLDDAKGPNVNVGHYQCAPGFAEDGYDVPVTDATNYTYCYTLDGEGYIYEYSFMWSRFSNADGVVMDAATVQALPEKMGFDIVINDRDEATGVRTRQVWQHDGSTGGEAWDNMNGAGTVTLVNEEVGVGVKNIAAASMNVYPNPVIDQLTISAKFNQVVITNLVGQQVKSIQTSSKTVNVSDLAKGVYVVKALNNGKQVGIAKFTKN